MKQFNEPDYLTEVSIFLEAPSFSNVAWSMARIFYFVFLLKRDLELALW